MSALLEIAGLSKEYPLARGLFSRRAGVRRALDGVDLSVARGECVALVGESGSGKTTLGRAALLLLRPTAGTVRFDGCDLTALGAAELRHRRRRFQMIFQDPASALDPRYPVGRAVSEPLAVHEGLSRRACREAAAELLARVGLAAELGDRLPHQLSGGQRQRVGIARALATAPDLLVADEPTSALDVSVRGQILALLADLRRTLGLAVLLIAHDLAAVAQLADRVAVLYAGRIVELAPAADLFARPQHPHTRALLAAVPKAVFAPDARNQPGVR